MAPAGPSTNFLIAYPDHVTAPGRPSLAVLDEFVTRHLAPRIGGVHTLPLHPSTSDGGFSVVDPGVVDDAYGDWDDVRRLAAHHRWMADAVVNHVSASSPWLAGYLAGSPQRAGFFRELPAGTDVSAVVRPRTSPLGHDFTRPDGSTVRLWTTFSADQVDLDLANPAVLVAVAEMVLRYVRAGAAAVRLDAVAFLWKDPARSSMSLPETHAVVQVLRTLLDEAAPGCLLVTETNVPAAENVAYLGGPSTPEAGAVYQFPLPPLVLDALLGGDATVLNGWLGALPAPPSGATYLNMLATHDGIGLRGAEGLLDDARITRLIAATEASGGTVNRRDAPGGAVPYELCTTWYSVLAEGHPPAAAMARHLAGHAIALALQGIPLLYLGALAAAANDRDRLAATGHGRDLNRTRFDADDLSRRLADRRTPAGASWTGLAGLLDRRAGDGAFAPEAAQVVADTGRHAVVIERRAAGGHTTCVAVNVTGAVQRVELADGSAVTLGPWAVHWPVGAGTY